MVAAQQLGKGLLYAAAESTLENRHDPPCPAEHEADVGDWRRDWPPTRRLGWPPRKLPRAAPRTRCIDGSRNPAAAL